VAPAIAYWCDACFVNTSVVLDRAVSGTSTSSLAQVLSRLLLEGHNYFIKWQATEIEVIVIGLQRDRAVAIERPRLPPGHSLALPPEAVRLKSH
jgi:hypothetical protein